MLRCELQPPEKAYNENFNHSRRTSTLSDKGLRSKVETSTLLLYFSSIVAIYLHMWQNSILVSTYVGFQPLEILSLDEITSAHRKVLIQVLSAKIFD